MEKEIKELKHQISVNVECEQYECEICGYAWYRIDQYEEALLHVKETHPQSEWIPT